MTLGGGGCGDGLNLGDVEGRMYTEGWRKSETNGTGVNNSLDHKGSNETGGAPFRGRSTRRSAVSLEERSLGRATKCAALEDHGEDGGVALGRGQTGDEVQGDV